MSEAKGGYGTKKEKTNLLISEPPLQVLPSLAVAIGLNEAIVLQQLHYWLENKSAGIERDGFKWIFNTYDEWAENFPFWSVSTIQRIFSKLEEMGLVISEQLDKHKHDMKKFYRIDYGELCKMDDVNLTRSDASKRHDVNKNTETTAEIDIDAVVSKMQEYKFKIDPRLPFMLDDWRKDFPGRDDVILQAIEDAHVRGANSAAYVEGILISWKANGVPPTREERKAAAMNQPQKRKQSTPEYRADMVAWLQKEGVKVDGLQG